MKAQTKTVFSVIALKWLEPRSWCLTSMHQISSLRSQPQENLNTGSVLQGRLVLHVIKHPFLLNSFVSNFCSTHTFNLNVKVFVLSELKC